MKRLGFTSLLMSTCLPFAAFASPAVYPGCAVPALKSGHHTFYIDPVKGSPNGDGSAAKPWRTLAEVLAGNSSLLSTMGHRVAGGTDALTARNPNGPIKAGDVLMLMSGSHGAVFIQNAFNSDFVTVMAAPGQTPTLQSLAFQSSQKWLFQGIKVIPGTNSVQGIGIVTLAYGDWLGSTNNIILDSSVVATVENASSWSEADWLSKPKGVGIYAPKNTFCMSMTNNHIFNVVNGIGIDSSQALAQGNVIEYMMNDGIDLSGSNVTVRGNTIKNGENNSLSVLHADGIQGWPQTVNGVAQVVNNVTIDGNTVVKTGDGSRSYMQGISIFDGTWKNLTVSNNSVSVNAWNGMVLSGLLSSKVINNTVYGTYAPQPTRLTVSNAKDASPSQATVLRNNIAQNMIVNGSYVLPDHNVASTSITINGKVTTKGSVGTANMVATNIVNGFVTFNIAGNAFDLRLRTSSPAVAFGNVDQAPAVDLLGKTRSKPTDAGAYNH